MFYNIFVSALLLYTNSVFSEELALTNHFQSFDLILCRICGSDISSSNFITFKSSPESQHTFNDTLFNRSGVIVQMLEDFFFYVPAITVSQSTCKPIGEWSESDSFPGYHWKVCVCPDCGANIGWVFKPSNPYREEAYKPFYDTMSADDKDFLAKCEEELKHRYTEQDEEFMKVFNAEASIPPIIKSWWDPQNSRRRNDRRNNRHNPYGNRDHDRRRYNDYNRDHDRRGYNDYSSRGQGYHNQRHPYY